MKKNSSIIRTLAALLMAGAALVSCSKDEEQPVSQTYTMTVKATKGSDKATKDLSLDGTTLNATWAQGERVTVYNVSRSANLGGYLEAQSDGASTTLSGTLTGTVMAGDNLNLYFLTQGYYTSQDGTLEYIASHCDYAKATVTVENVASGNITTTSTASFENKQSIVKFTLQNASGSAISASELQVTFDATTYIVTPASARSEYYVALPGFSGKTVTLTATTASGTYTYTNSSTSFSNSQYYTITVKMGKLIDLSTLSTDYEAQNGDVLTGNLNDSYQLTVASGATVTLKGATINPGINWAGITCSGNATIVLQGGNTVTTGTNSDHSGIHFPTGSTLTIKGSGSLTISTDWGAGIGAGWEMPCGNIVIEDGTIEATSNYACAIGCAQNTACGNITISGGYITAQGGEWCAGIGAATGGSDYAESECGNINITGGTHPKVAGGENAPAIGSGWPYDEEDDYSSCGNINITGGSCKMLDTGSGASYTIGPAPHGACGTVTVYGSTGYYTNGSFGY